MSPPGIPLRDKGKGTLGHVTSGLTATMCDLVRALQLGIEPRYVGDRARIDRRDEGQAKVTRHGAVIGSFVDQAAVKPFALNAGAVAPRPVGQRRKQWFGDCLLYTSPSPRDRTRSRMPSSA